MSITAQCHTLDVYFLVLGELLTYCSSLVLAVANVICYQTCIVMSPMLLQWRRIAAQWFTAKSGPTKICVPKSDIWAPFSWVCTMSKGLNYIFITPAFRVKYIKWILSQSWRASCRWWSRIRRRGLSRITCNLSCLSRCCFLGTIVYIAIFSDVR